MTRLHAVILDDHFTPYRLPLFEKLASEQVDVTIVYCSRRLPEREWSVPDDFPFMSETLPAWVIRLPRWLFRGEHRTVIVNFNLWWRLIRLRPDVVVGYAYSLPAWTAFVYSRLFKIPYVAWSTDTPHTASRPDRVQRFSRRKIIGSAALCLTPSLQGRQQFLSYGAPTEQIRVAAQSVSDAFAEQASRAVRSGEAYIQRHQLNGKTILYVGFLTRSKGLDDLVRAFGHLAKELNDVHLLLVGSGPLKGHIERTAHKLGIEDRVHLAGFVQPDDMPRVYAGVSLFVFPTRTDTFGVVVAEAIACGLPVVCSTYAGSAGMLVEDGVNGFLIDPRDSEQLKDAMLRSPGR